MRRIGKAWALEDTRKVIYLQNLLIHSTSAKLLAVKAVTSNRGKYTSGIDDVIWVNPDDKFNAAVNLNRRGYKPSPLKRVYMPKISGGMRMLSIPTMRDRAMQTLYKFALEPIAELWADKHSYGFRPNLSTRDALIRLWKILYTHREYIWVLKADIKSCFDNLSHEWIMDNIPIDKEILRKFLKCGYVDNNKFHMTNMGVPQGGSISPIICNMALDGLENGLIDNIGDVEYIRYADDILIISPYFNKLHQAINIIDNFLSPRGLSLSENKTCITKVDEGFNFLGWFIRMDNDFPYIIPSKSNVNSLLYKIRDVCINNKGNTDTINKLQAIIVGWLGYHQGVADDKFIQDILSSIQTIIYNTNGY